MDKIKEKQLHDLLMNEDGCVTIEEAMKEAEKKWSEKKRITKH